MHISEFDFHLPEHLIAQNPPAVRGSSRLLVAQHNRPIEDRHFPDLPNYIAAGDVLVFNNTKVMKARLFGQKATGGKIEALIERVLDEHTTLAHIRSSKSPKAGTELIFEGSLHATMTERVGELFKLQFHHRHNVYTLLEEYGALPLPPYIVRPADDNDDARYQTVYAKYQGAVAAPTAGLHFTHEILSALQQKGVEFAEVTLHVGAGTFQPVRVDNIAEHKMHSEWFDVPEATVAKIQAAKARGDTDIFITPGYTFRVIDGLITNFHLPKSTLLMLVSAFAGSERIREIYRHAIEQEYRFFSYGDAMLLHRA